MVLDILGGVMILYDKFIKKFEEKMKESKTFISTRTEICEYLNQVSGHYSKNTAFTQLSNFETTIYHAAICQENPVFDYIGPRESSALNPLSNLHYLMFRFLTNGNSGILDFKITTHRFSSIYSIEYPYPSFKWKIPSIFMPFLAAYILACTKQKDSWTFSVFFEKLESSFSESLSCAQKYIPDESQSDMKDFFQAWTANYLGKLYFLNLDKLLQSFSQKEEYQSQILRSIHLLTTVLLHSPLFPNPIPYYLDRLSEHFAKEIKKHEAADLFPHPEPWRINDEQSFVRSLTAFIMFQIKSFRDSIHAALKKHHIKDSKYELAVDDYPSFVEDIFKSYLNLYSACEQSEVILRRFFELSNNNPDVQKGLSNNRLTISYANEEKHIKFFKQLVEKCAESVFKESDKFLKLVSLSSSDRAVHSKKITVKQDYYYTFKKNISTLLRNFKTGLITKYPDLPAPFYYHQPGAISKIGFSDYVFTEQDILKIFSVLVPKTNVLVSEHILNLLAVKGFQFPMSADGVVNLLLHLNDIIQNQ